MRNLKFKLDIKRWLPLCFISILFFGACSENQDPAATNDTPELTHQKDAVNSKSNSKTIVETNYKLLQKKIIYGSAKLSEVKEALTDKNVGSLTNTIHALYSMRWHRGVYNLLDDMWLLKKKDHPDLAWELLEKAPVRIALASTINRIKIINTDEQLGYIRSHKNDEHEFHRAQVVVALGMNGSISDIDYIKSMAMGDNDYVAQSAISGLALMGGQEAKYALGEIWKEFQGTPRGNLAENVIHKAYGETPSLRKPESNTAKALTREESD